MASHIEDHPVARLLVKRSRIQTLDTTQPTPQPHTKRLRKQFQPSTHSPLQNCIELCSLLLEKVGADPSASGPAVLHQILSKEYTPRALELLVDITAAVDRENKPQNYEPELTTSTSDEDNFEAVVPSLPHVPTPPTNPYNDALVPQLSAPHLRTITANSKHRHPTPPPAEPKAVPAYKKETEIAISRIFSLGQVASVQDNSIQCDAPYHGPSVVTMTGFGELGRFGNQVIQYMFLKSYSMRHNIEEIQVPQWVGGPLFGLSDRPVHRALPPVVEFPDTLANSTFTRDLIEFVKNSNKDRHVAELHPSILSTTHTSECVGQQNVDIWGWFQWHTSHFAPFKRHIQDTFEPIPAVKQHLDSIFKSQLRYKDGKRRTVIGLHMRLGDYQNIAASSFGYCAPTSWYLEWLDSIWHTLDNPVLFVASDDVDAVLRDFAKYDPITSDSMGMTMPSEMKEMKAGFFPDWYSLTQCDILAISNSTFSFTACLMNRQKDAKFFRAHYNGGIVPIDPWNSDPVVHRDLTKGGISSLLGTLQVLYNTQGSRGVAKNLFYELPYYGVRAAIMKAVLWRQAQKATSNS